jgi:hypothetical protein
MTLVGASAFGLSDMIATVVVSFEFVGCEVEE